MELVCEHCEATFPRKRTGPIPRYCSASCRARACSERAEQDGRAEVWRKRANERQRAKRPKRTCRYCGCFVSHGKRIQCGKPECVRAHNRIRTREYKRRRNARKLLEKAFDCAHCERHCIPGQGGVSMHATKFCSRKCKGAWHAGRIHQKRAPRCRLSSQSSAPRLWIEGPCVECGERMCRRDRRGAVGYCSSKCYKRAQRRRRRAATAGEGYKTLRFWSVAERDGWVCGLCGQPVPPGLTVPNPLAPTMDHIIPLAAGGSHTEDNVQLAHFICNSRKGDGTSVATGKQAALV